MTASSFRRVSWAILAISLIVNFGSVAVNLKAAFAIRAENTLLRHAVEHAPAPCTFAEVEPR